MHNGANEMGHVDLYWIPLGAGGHFVRFNGMVYEAVSAAVQRRPRCDIFHSALEITIDSGHYTVEMTPVPRQSVEDRGVVVEGPVGSTLLRRFKTFRYEVRRWRDGAIPDLQYAVASPVRATDDPALAGRVFDLLPSVPPMVWGRDELRAGEMWSCNSIISWALTKAGIDTANVALPAGARAPGWDAGASVAAGRHPEAVSAVAFGPWRHEPSPISNPFGRHRLARRPSRS